MRHEIHLGQCDAGRRWRVRRNFGLLGVGCMAKLPAGVRGFNHPMTNLLKMVFVSLAFQLAAQAQPATEQTILHASEVYVIQLREVDGVARSIIEAIWRHDPGAGTAPAVGSELTEAGPYKQREMIYFKFRPRLKQGDKQIGAQAVPIINGQVPRFQMSAEDLKDLIQSTKWVPSPAK